MKGGFKWRIAAKVLQAVGVAVLGVAVDTGALDGSIADAVAAVLAALSASS
jgi:hypothetical protein